MNPSQSDQIMSDAERAAEDGRSEPPQWVRELGAERLWRLARADEVLRIEQRRAYEYE